MGFLESMRHKGGCIIKKKQPQHSFLYAKNFNVLFNYYYVNQNE